MQLTRTIFLSILLLFGFFKSQAQQDSVHYQKDSAEENADSTSIFFQTGEKVKMPSKLMLVTKTRKTISLAAFLKSLGEYADHALADLDNDGQKELLVYNFTGGAHCCDEIYIFKNTGLNKYQHVVKFFSGNTVITADKQFRYDFYERLGYFFTCYACAYPDTSDESPVFTSSILLRYNKGKILLVPPNMELRSTINDNLGKLGEQPYEKLEDASSFDNGLRKEVALNLAVFYYSFGRNISGTQKLFNKYYKFPDTRKVWASFVQQLQSIKNANDF